MSDKEPNIGNVNFSNINESEIKVGDINTTITAGGDIVGGDKTTIGEVKDGALAIGERSASATKGGIAVSGNVGGNLIISMGNTVVALPFALQIAIGVIVVALPLLIGLVSYNTVIVSAPTPTATPTSIPIPTLTPTPVRMTGSFNIAIAQFQITGMGEGIQEAETLSQGIANTIGKEIEALETGIDTTIAICPPPSGKTQICPPQIDKIQGETEERAQEASNMANAIDADVIIYGLIEVNGYEATVRPEFYINNKTFRDEIAGQYWIGSDILIPEISLSSLRADAEQTLKNRFRALSFIIYGLSDYAAGKYEPDKYYPRAEIKFLQALEIEEWDNPDVIYVLLGNANLKQRQWEKAESYYTQALETNPDYARALVGLGSVFLAQATTETTTDTYAYNTELLEQSIILYETASKSEDQPPLADIPTKVNFGLGQSYLTRALIEQNTDNIEVGDDYYQLARESFQAVIQNYEAANAETQERVRELTADAHALIGLIYWLEEEPAKAIPEYKEAIELLPDSGQAKERKAVYQETLDKLQKLVEN